jgi:hypothetical protein
MGQEDYLKRQIDQIGRILGKILVNFLDLKSNGQVSAGIEMTNQALKNELDFDVQELKNIQPDIFIHILISEKKLTNDNLEKLVEILLLIADNTEGKDKEILNEKCLVIYEYLEKTSNVYSFDRQWKMKRIKNNIN